MMIQAKMKMKAHEKKTKIKNIIIHMEVSFHFLILFKSIPNIEKKICF